MGTRSIILVKKRENNKTTVHRLYKHWDGYPTDNLKMIHAALSCCNDIEHFVSQCESYYREGMVEETSHSDTLDPEIFGCQCDLEWIYTVDLDAKHVKIFGGGYSGQDPYTVYQKGTVDPVSYADCLIDSYQDNERTAIRLSIEAIQNLGYKVN